MELGFFFLSATADTIFAVFYIVFSRYLSPSGIIFTCFGFENLYIFLVRTVNVNDK